MDVIWLNPSDYVSADDTLALRGPFEGHTWTTVTSSALGDLKWVTLALRLPAGVRIENISVGYQAPDAGTFISELRLIEVGDPKSAVVLHDDATVLASATPTTFVSPVGKIPSADKAVALQLRVHFQDVAHSLQLGAVGVSVSPPAVRSVSTLAELRHFAGATGAQALVAGYWTPLDGGGSTFYWDFSSTEPDDAGVTIAVSGLATGRWKRLLTPAGLSVKHFGAKGDFNNPVDDTAPIQAAIDHAIRNKIACVFVPDGHYITTGPIHLGYGETYHSVSLIGADSSFADGFPGATIEARFADAPAIVVQGGRDVNIKNLRLVGVSAGYGISTLGPRIWAGKVPHDEVLDPKRWVTNVPANALTRFAVYAGIAIDPYSGTRPSPSYPDVAYPAWANVSSQYGKNFSSDTTIENVNIDGFYIGIANQPCDDDGNGDFTTIRDCAIVNCGHAISVGNTQSRNVGVYNSQFQFVHTIVSTDLVGRCNGQLGGPIVNCSAGQIYQVFSLPNAISSPLILDSFYVEEFIRLGVADLGGAASNPILLNACNLVYAGFVNGVVNGVKTRAIYNVPLYVGAAPITFNGSRVLFSSDFGLVTGKFTTVLLRNAALEAWGYNGTVTTEPQKLAYNYLLGGAAVLGDDRSLEGRVNVSLLIGIADPNPSPPATDGFTNVGAGRSQIHNYVRYFQYGNGPRIAVQSTNQPQVLGFGTGMIDPVFNAQTLKLTFTYPNNLQANYNTWRIEPGCILWHQNTNSMFVVDTVEPDGSDWLISSMMVTNYQNLEGGRVPILPVDKAGDVLLYQTFHKSTTYQYRGDTTSGSPIITNVRRCDGYKDGVPEDFKIGDLLFNNPLFWDNYLPPCAKIQAVGSGTITMDKPASASALGVPIELYR